MKDMLKRVLASIAAAALAGVGLAVGSATANASLVTGCGTDGVDCTVILNATNDAQFIGHTYKAIKIADYDVYGDSPNQVFTLKTVDGIKTQVTAAVNAAIAPETVPTDPAGIDPLAWAQQQDDAKLDKSVDSPYLGDGTTRKLADALRDSIGDSASPLVGPNDAQEGSAGTITVEGKTAEITFNSPGLWLILDQSKVDATDTATGSSKAVSMLVGTPLTINKTNTSEGTVISNGTANVKNQVVSIAKTVDDNTVQQGENAKYTLSTKIPNYVGYKVQGYSFTITDKFDAGAPMEYVPGTMRVYVGEDGSETELTPNDDYVVTGFSANSNTFTIDLSGYILKKAFGVNKPTQTDTFTDGSLAGDPVRVVYEAKVTGSTGNEGVLNAPSITYTNDPSTNATGDVPGPGVKVFNFDYTIQKKDRITGKPLSGATFVIYPEGGSEDPLQTVTTDNDGKAMFTGLDDDVNYVIEETDAPTDYMNVGLKFNLNIDAKITGEHENAKVDVTYKVTGDMLDLVSDGNGATVIVENVKNITQLPLTGAAGTMLFTVLGLLIAGAGALAYIRSRNVKRALRG